MINQKRKQRLAGLITLLVFVFSFIVPIPKAEAGNLSRLAEAIKDLNGGSAKYYYTTDNRIWEKIVEPSKLNDYMSRFKNPEDKCNSSLDYIYWTWKSTYNKVVRPSNANISTPISSYTGGGLTYRTSTLIFYVIYKDKDGKEGLLPILF